MKLKKLFNSASQLSFTHLLLLGEAWLVFLKWDLLVSYFHYRHWQLSFDKPQPVIDDEDHLRQILDIIKLTEKVARNHIRKMNCLRRCLCQRQLLAKRNYPCELHIGVKITDGKVEAHSWLSYNSIVINDSQQVIAQYTELEKSANQGILAALRG